MIHDPFGKARKMRRDPQLIKAIPCSDLVRVTPVTQQESAGLRLTGNGNVYLSAAPIPLAKRPEESWLAPTSANLEPEVLVSSKKDFGGGGRLDLNRHAEAFLVLLYNADYPEFRRVARRLL